jgi:hypothetical protein
MFWGGSAKTFLRRTADCWGKAPSYAGFIRDIQSIRGIRGIRGFAAQDASEPHFFRIFSTKRAHKPIL